MVKIGKNSYRSHLKIFFDQFPSKLQNLILIHNAKTRRQHIQAHNILYSRITFQFLNHLIKQQIKSNCLLLGIIIIIIIDLVDLKM